VFLCSLKIAILGKGGKDFGEFLYKNETININEIFIKNKVSTLQDEKARLEKDELTPKRLIRLFRFLIQQFIKKAGIESTLFTKFGRPTGIKPEYCFLGSEHVVPLFESEKLRETYKNMDYILKTNFLMSCDRVLSTRFGGLKGVANLK